MPAARLDGWGAGRTLRKDFFVTAEFGHFLRDYGGQCQPDILAPSLPVFAES
jgi:hypothetical protein